MRAAVEQVDDVGMVADGDARHVGSTRANAASTSGVAAIDLVDADQRIASSPRADRDGAVDDEAHAARGHAPR